MSKKIIVLCGSPRKNGNTNRLVKGFVAGAEGAGASVEVVDTARLKYKTLGCLACMNCAASEKFVCSVKDDAQPILARLPEVDVIVMATPVYWFGPTAQLKVFADRMMSLIKMNPDDGTYSHRLKGKTLALIATGGGDLESGLNCLELSYSTGAQFLEMAYESLLVPNAPLNPEEIEKDTALKDKVIALGARLAS